MTQAPKKIHLKDYTPPSYWIPKVDLTFDIYEEKTRVTALMQIERNRAVKTSSPLVLNGEEMHFLAAFLDDVQLESEEYQVDENQLTIFNLPDKCVLKIENEIDPANNTKLMGLYRSGGIFCTQCEAEGFRRITYFLDRPDIMSMYTTKIIADKKKFPILLSNGNCLEEGELSEGRHWALWEDPFAKPCYLFAMVAGDLGMIQDSFTTMSNRKIDLRIYCDKGNESKCAFAMESLKKSMKWDEEVFGLEYDLDIFMIVAVDAFNFGAMENKGLNIFNTNAILADQGSATDDNFIRVEKVIGHEYFHNWTGDRVTLRDWFQLTLKEGLTVYRDQEFTADMQSRAWMRIEDVRMLREHQFPEDAGPMAHPIKPKTYIEIDNFYTSTVYKKGAEIIRMIETFIGKDAFRKGMDTYFELYDGKAVTTEDFIHAMEVASGRDFSHFKLWYDQAKTPVVSFSFEYKPLKRELILKIKQNCPKAKGEYLKKPFHFPLKTGLLGKVSGNPLSFTYQGKSYAEGESAIVEISKKSEKFAFTHVKEAPCVSLNRDFSAPVHINTPYTLQDMQLLMMHDTNLFNRYEMGQQLAEKVMEVLITDHVKNLDLKVNPAFEKAFEYILEDKKMEPGVKALTLILPSETSLIERQKLIHIEATHAVRHYLKKFLAEKFEKSWVTLYESCEATTPKFSIDPENMGRRKLKNVALGYLMNTYKKEYAELALNQFKQANNMTDQYGALTLLCQIDCPEKEIALEAFYDQWHQDLLTLSKWFAAQASSICIDTLSIVQKLTGHAKFDMKVPNLVRALIGTFAGNHIRFHEKSGLGYSFVASQILMLNKINPNIGARLALGFKYTKRLDKTRKALALKELNHLLEAPGLAKGIYEVCEKIVNE